MPSERGTKVYMVRTCTDVGVLGSLQSHARIHVVSYQDTPEHVQGMQNGRGGVWCRRWLWGKSLSLCSCLRGAVTE